MFWALNAVLRLFEHLPVANWRHRKGLAAFLLVTFAIAGCAVSPYGDGLKADSPAEAKAEAVKARAAKRWDALIKGDYAGAYAYMSPTSRERTPIDVYKQRLGMVRFTDAKVEEVTCTAQSDSCKVTMRVTYDHRKFRGVTTPMEETWVVDKGQVWYVYRG
jgi:hypothetical protein